MRLSKARKEIVTAVMKDTICEAASSVLVEHGVGGITMERVASSVGLATGSLYNYFQDKHELLKFIYTRLVEPFLQSLEEIVHSNLLAPQRLERVLRMALEHSCKHKALIRLLAQSDQESEVRRNVHSRVLHLFTTIFEQGIQEGSFRPHNSGHTGRMFVGCLSELFEQQREGASDEEANAYVDALIDAIHNGFSIHAEKSPGSGEANLSPANPQQSS